MIRSGRLSGPYSPGPRLVDIGKHPTGCRIDQRENRVARIDHRAKLPATVDHDRVERGVQNVLGETCLLRQQKSSGLLKVGTRDIRGALGLHESSLGHFACRSRLICGFLRRHRPSEQLLAALADLLFLPEVGGGAFNCRVSLANGGFHLNDRRPSLQDFGFLFTIVQPSEDNPFRNTISMVCVELNDGSRRLEASKPTFATTLASVVPSPKISMGMLLAGLATVTSTG